jgi:phosphate transport system substrate-binding protein
MKTNKITLIAVIILVLANATASKVAAQDLKGNISISGAFALYPITVKWAEEFKKINPNVKIDIQAGGAGKGITDVLSKVTDIGLVSRDLNAAEFKKGAFAIAVTKDAVIPTISATSPYKKVLY